MSFLNQLKQQAQSLQTRQGDDLQQLEANTLATEAACKTVWHYLMELPRQHNIAPHKKDRKSFFALQKNFAQAAAIRYKPSLNAMQPLQGED